MYRAADDVLDAHRCCDTVARDLRDPRIVRQDVQPQKKVVAYRKYRVGRHKGQPEGHQLALSKMYQPAPQAEKPPAEHKKQRHVE